MEEHSLELKPYFVLVLLWLGYFILHSLLAAPGIKDYLRRLTGLDARNYRLLYTVVAVVTLLPVLYFNASVSGGSLIPEQSADIVQFAGLVLATYGVIIVRLAFKQQSVWQFLGLKSAEGQDNHLHTEGIHGRIRHPLYAGALLLLAGFWLFSPTLANLITSLMAILYIFVGIQLEEAKLLRLYGQQYQDYRQQVPMLIPSLRRKR